MGNRPPGGGGGGGGGGGLHGSAVSSISVDEVPSRVESPCANNNH